MGWGGYEVEEELKQIASGVSASASGSAGIAPSLRCDQFAVGNFGSLRRDVVCVLVLRAVPHQQLQEGHPIVSRY